MTAAENSLPHTPTTAKRVQVGLALGLDGAWTLAEEIAYRTASVYARWPLQAAGVTVAAIASPYVTWSHVTGGVLATSVALVIRPGMRVRIPSLIDLSTRQVEKARIKARWTRVCADNGLTKAGKDKDHPRVPRIRRVEWTPAGVRLVVSGGPMSMSTDMFVSKANGLRTGLGARDIQITSKDTDTVIDLITKDPFSRVSVSKDMPAPGVPGAVVTGLDSFGQPVEERPDKHRLYVGEPGSGKSSAMWRLIQGMQEAGIPFRLRIFDPKDGVEFSALEDAAYDYERDPMKFGDFLVKAFRAKEARGAAMREAGIRRLMEPSEEWPMDIIIVDELVTALLLNKKTKVRVMNQQMDVMDAVVQYLSVGPGQQHFIWAATQLGQKSVLDILSEMFMSKTLLRVSTDDVPNIVFGTGGAKLYPAHKIPKDKSGDGIGYTHDVRRGPIKYRAAWVTPADRRKIADTMSKETAVQRARTAWDKGES